MTLREAIVEKLIDSGLFPDVSYGDVNSPGLVDYIHDQILSSTNDPGEVSIIIDSDLEKYVVLTSLGTKWKDAV